MRAVAQSGGPRSNQISGTFWLRRSRGTIRFRLEKVCLQFDPIELIVEHTAKCNMIRWISRIPLSLNSSSNGWVPVRNKLWKRFGVADGSTGSVQRNLFLFSPTELQPLEG